MFLASYPDHSQYRSPGKARKRARKAIKAVAYILVCLLIFLWKGIFYALAWGQDCSGTGTGNTRFYRVCNELSFFMPLALDLLLLTLLAWWRPTRRLRPVLKAILYVLYTIYVIASPLLWNLPFFLTSTYRE